MRNSWALSLIKMRLVLGAVIGAVGQHGLVVLVEQICKHLAVMHAGRVVLEVRMSLVFKSAFTWFFQP
jgi:ABC-type methionine transport system ATPase subunit